MAYDFGRVVHRMQGSLEVEYQLCLVLSNTQYTNLRATWCYVGPKQPLTSIYPAIFTSSCPRFGSQSEHHVYLHKRIADFGIEIPNLPGLCKTQQLDHTSINQGCSSDWIQVRSDGNARCQISFDAVSHFV